jgi:hypothetical protein
MCPTGSMARAFKLPNTIPLQKKQTSRYAINTDSGK